MKPTAALLQIDFDSIGGEQLGLSLARLIPKLFSFLEVACARSDVSEASLKDVSSWVEAPLPDGSMPSVATRHNRRAAARLAFRLLREQGIVDHDPTVDLRLPPREPGREARPLTDVEVTAGRSAAQRTMNETRLPAVWALAEATATTHEIPRVRWHHVNLGEGTVLLPGSKKIEPRSAALTEWGRMSLHRRLDSDADTDTPIAYQGAGRSEAAMQASASGALGRILTDAGLRTDPVVKPSSVRAWAGWRIWHETGRIEDVAIALGCRTLDTAAAIIGFDWRDLR